jgi:hypothetical protein
VIDLNNIESGGGSDFELIPDSTIVRAIITIKPNAVTMPEFSNTPIFKASQTTSAKWLEVEYTIIGGQFDKRKFWQNHFFDGDAKDDSGVSKSKKIGLQWLKSVVESHNNISALDASSQAQAVRQIDMQKGGVASINGMNVCVKIGIEKSNDPMYSDKNRCKIILTNGMEGYIPNGSAPTAPVTPSPAPTNNGNAVPDWAR